MATWKPSLEYRQVLTVLYKLVNRISVYSTLDIYRDFVVAMYDDVLGATLGIDEDELTSLFWKTFRSKIVMHNLQMSSAWQCYRWVLPIWDKLSKHGYNVRQACPKWSLSDETILHASVQCAGITDLWSYVQQLLSYIGEIRLSAGSIIIAPSWYSYVNF